MKKFHWRVAVFALASLVASCGGGGGGDTGPVTTPPTSEPPASPFSVSNPFAISGATSVDQVRVDDLRVFGDSYSVPSWQGTKSWSTVLRENGTARNIANYAISGAKAAAGADIAFGRQIDTWQASGTAIGNRDLTVTYFGYNDLGGDLAAGRAGYRTGIDRLVAEGAASSGRRLFVTQLHDWSRNPSVAPSLAQDVRDWNSFVAGIANGNSGIVAVDLFTVFERVFANPSAYGFTNVSSIDRANADSTALFFDGFHFGDRGQDIIARVYRHYLTRGWDWANSIAAGSNAAARLTQDLDNGRLVLGLADAADASGRAFGFTIVPLGKMATEARFGDGPAGPSSQDPARAYFADAKGGNAAAGGVALDYGLDPTATVGLAIARYDSNQSSTRGMSAIRQDQTSDALALYWQTAQSGFTVTSRFAYLDHEMSDRAHDDLLGQSGVSQHGGSSWSLDQRIARPARIAATTLTPWASLAYQQHELAPYTATSLYTSDLRYSGANVVDVIGSVGVDVRHDGIPLGFGRQLWLSGKVAMTSSLHRDDAEVRITEATQPGIVQREAIERDTIQRFDLSLDAVLGLAEALNLRASYGVVADESDREQRIGFHLDYRF